jgi:thiol-disulfide isomerase/thioredoxin
MRELFFLLALIIAISGCKNKPDIDYDYVSAQFKEFSDKIEKLQYNVQSIDTFAQSGTVWNHEGFALIERDDTDKLFGFSFYGKRFDISNDYLYDKGNAFIISKEERTYRVERENPGFLGSPGGQMISRDLFVLDTAYRTAKVIETAGKYLVMYEFHDDTTHDVTSHAKTIELSKSHFFPTKITRSYEMLGNKAVHQMIFSNVRVNNEVENSIADYKEEFTDFEIIQEKRREANKLLNTKLDGINLPNLIGGGNERINFESDKITLIDFWEVWCGWCIKSFPEVERLSKTYNDKLRVIGIVTEDKETAIRLIDRKGITFLNLFADKEYLKKFSVDSYPRYFLIDNNGIVQKEYFGFSDEIEADIKNMMAK